jgi:hypothetical protein
MKTGMLGLILSVIFATNASQSLAKGFGEARRGPAVITESPDQGENRVLSDELGNKYCVTVYADGSVSGGGGGGGGSGGPACPQSDQQVSE